MQMKMISMQMMQMVFQQQKQVYTPVADVLGHNVTVNRDTCNRDATSVDGAAGILGTGAAVLARDGDMAGTEKAAFRSWL